ncbi:MAG: peroxiredoxin family protein [Gemmatimonadaceae bacterium]
MKPAVQFIHNSKLNKNRTCYSGGPGARSAVSLLTVRRGKVNSARLLAIFPKPGLSMSWRSMWVERALLAALTVLAFFLIQDARLSRARELQLNRKLREPWRGNAMATFTARAIQGDTVTVARVPVGTKQLVYVFTTRCAFCRRSNAHLVALRRSLDSAAVEGQVRVQVVGISLDSLPETERYVKEQALGFPVVLFPERKLRLIYKTQVVPSLMLLTDEGRVILGRLGVFETTSAYDSLLKAALTPPPNRESSPVGDPTEP